jgi:hypothetical protein
MSLGFYTAEDFRYMASTRLGVLMDVAKTLGENHPITEMMGSIAWGRHDYEEGPDRSLRTAVESKAYLDGVCRMLREFAHRAGDTQATSLLAAYPRGYAKALRTRDED